MFEVVPESEMNRSLRFISNICLQIGCTLEHIEDPTFTTAEFQIWDEDEIPISETQHREIVQKIIEESDDISSSQIAVLRHTNGAVRIKLSLEEDLTNEK
jgi:hypothetical protein